MWQTFSTIINIILAAITAYFYLENRKLKGFEVERKLEIKKAELEKLVNDYLASFNYGSVSIFDLGKDPGKEEREYNYKKLCLEAEIKEFIKIINKYHLKWFFQ